MRLEYFQLIDRILDISIEERTIRTEATVPTESTIFEGHFPGFPLMPGALLIETMAQTSGWLVIALLRFERMPFLMGATDVKFRRFVKPGEKLAADASLVHEGSGYAVTTGWWCATPRSSSVQWRSRMPSSARIWRPRHGSSNFRTRSPCHD